MYSVKIQADTSKMLFALIGPGLGPQNTILIQEFDSEQEALDLAADYRYDNCIQLFPPIQPQDNSKYPAIWIKSVGVEAVMDYARENLKVNSYYTIAKDIGLLDENGNPATATNGEPCNVEAILAEIYDIPVEAVKL